MRLRLLTVAAVTGALVAVPVVGLPAPALAAAPHPVAGDDHDVDLGAAATVAPAAAAAPEQPGTAPQVVKEVSVGDGALVGVTLDAGTDAASVRVRVQDDDGAWGEWVPLSVEGGPDDGTAEARRAEAATGAGEGTVASDPLWIGEGDDDRRVQVQLPAGDAPDAELAVVDPGTSRADAAVAAGEAGRPAATASAAAVGMPSVHSRADWGADESMRSCSPSYAPTVRAAVLHHTAGTNDYTQAEVPAVLRGIYRYHVQSQGWCDVGYNVLVDRFGGLWEGRAGGLDRAVIGAHTGGFNTGTFGVSMIGTYSTVVPSAATLESVARIMAWKLGGSYRDPRDTVTLVSQGGGTSRYAAGRAVTLPVIFGHRDVGSTECPGDAAYPRLGWLRDRVAALAGAPSGTNYDKWQSLGGAGGLLGEPSAVEQSTPDGRARYTSFTGGMIYSTAATGAHEVHGAILGRWASLGWERSALRYPVTDETALPGGAYEHFEGGSVYWTPATDAQVVRGAVRDRWAAAGWERSVLGWPRTGTAATPDGTATYSHFQGGSVYSSPAGTVVIRGAVYDRWASLGWERSALGYPSTEAGTTPDARATYQHFQGGSVYVVSGGEAPGSYALTATTRDRWASMGWERSRLGYPTSSTTRTATGWVTAFEGGRVAVSTAGAVTVSLG